VQISAKVERQRGEHQQAELEAPKNYREHEHSGPDYPTLSGAILRLRLNATFGGQFHSRNSLVICRTPRDVNLAFIVRWYQRFRWYKA
jgi:hypothetical protein